MRISRWLTDGINYIFEAAARIFGPDHDSYPAVGIQPYEGDVYSSVEPN